MTFFLKEGTEYFLFVFLKKKVFFFTKKKIFFKKKSFAESAPDDGVAR